jgi:hypothetical protein
MTLRFHTGGWVTFPASTKPDIIRVEDYVRFARERGITNIESHLCPRRLTCPHHGEIDAVLDGVFRACCGKDRPDTKDHDCVTDSEKCWVFVVCGFCLIEGRRTPIYAVGAPLDL